MNEQVTNREARDLSKLGLEQCIDKMARTFTEAT